MNQTKQKEWEKEFENILTPSRCSGSYEYMIETRKMCNDFIHQLLAQQREEVIKEIEEIIEGMRGFAKKELVEKLSNWARVRIEQRDIGFNQAIDEVTQAIKKVGDKKIIIWIK